MQLEKSPMLEHYLAILFGLGKARGPACSARPEPPVTPQPDPSVAAGQNESPEWDPCPCRQWGVARSDRHGCVALCKELFPELDRELGTWAAEYGWLYRQ
jgi:hypothetical protein